MQPERDWTILLYMAGDNGRIFDTKHGSYSLMAAMTEAADADVAEIAQVETVGATPAVAVLAQLDTLGAKGTYRLEIQAGKTTQENIIATIPETNTGDPAELARFVVWGMERCPAKHTMLVLWNHGLGWKDDDIYQSVRAMSRTVRSGGRVRKQNAALFDSTAPIILELASQEDDEEIRGILCDDTSMDFLTNAELSEALKVAMFAADEDDVTTIYADKARLEEVVNTGMEGALRRLSVIGMDACLMAMLEVQYQVRQFADVMVASQDVEPLDGWPYTEIVSRLLDDPSAGPADLGRIIVEEYERFYFSKNTTLSAIDLGQLPELRRLVSDLAVAFDASYPEDKMLRLVWKSVVDDNRRTLEDREYLDLLSLSAGMVENYTTAGPALQATQALLTFLRSQDSPVVLNAATGRRKGRAHGISIYVAESIPSSLYQQLDFASSGWLTFLNTYANTPL